MMGNKAIILLSGGIDSLVCLALAKNAGLECYAISYDYGQRHGSELRAAKNIAALYEVTEHKIITINLDQLGGSALTDTNIPVPDYTSTSEIKPTYVPARNTIFLSIALGYAEIIGAKNIYFGTNVDDRSCFPDATAEYLQAFSVMANIAVKPSREGEQIIIQTPLITMGKAEIIKLGIELGVDYAETVSCYQASDAGLACGRCDSCVIRKAAFAAAGIADPTPYLG